MSALDEQIERSRGLIRRYDAEGHPAERDQEEARLSGLTFARQLLGHGDVSCLHPVHTTAGVDETGKQLWRCNRCGEIQ